MIARGYLAVAVGLALIPAAAAGGLRTAGSPPVAGLWKLHSANDGAPEVKSGSFTITSGQLVRGFTLTLGPGAESPCGTGNLTVKVVGQQHLVRDPLSDLGDPTDEYSISSPTDVLTGVDVKVAVSGKQQAGQLEIAFGAGTRGGPRTGGELAYNGGNCQISFGERKA